MAHILYVSLHTSPLDAPGSKDAGGMNVVELENARALAKLGHRVEIVTRRDNTTLPEVTEVAPGVTVRQLLAGPTEPLAKSAQESYITEFSTALMRLAPPDILHSQHWMSGVAALPVARAWAVPHVQSYHSVAALPGEPLSQGESPESAGRNAGEKLIAAQSDLIVAVSEYEAQTIIKRCGADPQILKIVNPGVDLELFTPNSDGTSHPCGYGDYLLFAGRLQPLKGADLALTALALLPARMRPDLVITGDVSKDYQDYLGDLKATAAELGVADNIRWCGSQSRKELAQLMRDSKIMLVPSHSETFGLVALEANAAGTAVIAANSGGLREAIADGETGSVLDSRDPAAWAAEIAQLLSNPDKLQNMGVAGRKRALDYSWERAAAQLDIYYNELLLRNSKNGNSYAV